MSKNWGLVGRDVLVTERTTFESRPNRKIGLRLSSIVRWEPSNPQPDSTMTLVWINDGREMLEIVVPFDEFTKIIARPTIITASD